MRARIEAGRDLALSRSNDPVIKDKAENLAAFLEQYPRLLLEKFPNEEDRWPLEAKLTPFIFALAAEIDFRLLMIALDPVADRQAAQKASAQMGVSQSVLRGMTAAFNTNYVQAQDSSEENEKLKNSDLANTQVDFSLLASGQDLEPASERNYRKLTVSRMTGFSSRDISTYFYLGLLMDLAYTIEEEVGMKYVDLWLDITQQNGSGRQDSSLVIGSPKAAAGMSDREEQGFYSKSNPKLAPAPGRPLNNDEFLNLAGVITGRLEQNQAAIDRLFDFTVLDQNTQDRPIFRAWLSKRLFGRYLAARMMIRNTMGAKRGVPGVLDNGGGLLESGYIWPFVQAYDHHLVPARVAESLSRLTFEALASFPARPDHAAQIASAFKYMVDNGVSLSGDEYNENCTEIINYDLQINIAKCTSFILSKI